MRRYGFEFVKGSGADYNARNVIEAVLLGAIICFPFLMFLNSNTVNIRKAFLSICFLYALFGFIAEILPKTGFSISLLFSTIVVFVASLSLFNEIIKTEPEIINILENLIIIAYATFVSTVNAYLLKSFFINAKKQNNQSI